MSDLSRPVVLVTGGAGYIGSYCARMLIERGDRVLVLDNLIHGHRQAVAPPAELVQGDVGDTSLLRDLFQRFPIDAVMHFAAYAYVGESVAEPAKYYLNNVAAPLALLQAMLDHHCRLFIFSSTCATYGLPQYLPLDEKHPQHPVNPYGKSKLILENIVADFGAAYNFRHAFLRYFNAAGASPDSRLGEDHRPETHLIPLVLQAAAGLVPQVTVFGNDYATSDGTCIRDYIHIEDLAHAHLMALDRLRGGSPSLACNLGTGRGVSVMEVIRAAETVSGRKIPVKIGTRRPGDPPELVADPSYAKEALGWQVKHTDLVQIIASAWKWLTGPYQGRFSF